MRICNILLFFAFLLAGFVARGSDSAELSLFPAQGLPQSIKSSWQYKDIAGEAAALAIASTLDSMPSEKRKEYADRSILIADWLIAKLGKSDAWWTPQSEVPGDPNLNRFVLAPLLDTIQILKKTGKIENYWPIWRPHIERTLNTQIKSYNGAISWDWASLSRYQYVNQDIYYALICQIGGQLFERQDLLKKSEIALQSIEKNTLPGGAFHYIGSENESPAYHALTQYLLARYYKISNNPLALKILQDSSKYWALTLSDEGVPEGWSDVWWKQNWLPVPVEAIGLSATVSSDSHLSSIYHTLIANRDAKPDILAYGYSLEWPVPSQNRYLPETNFLLIDDNILGVRGRHKDWYYGFTSGRGLRNTFVGGLISSLGEGRSLKAAFRGAQIEVKDDETTKHGYWLSQKKDNSTYKIIGKKYALLGTEYTLQSSQINGIPPPKTPDTPWKITQLWAIGTRGVIGTVSLQATADNNAKKAIGRLPLGPCEVIKVSDKIWSCGPLNVVIYSAFGAPEIKKIGAVSRSEVDNWQGIEFSSVMNGMKLGTELSYMVWVGPNTVQAPEQMNRNASTNWSAQWSDGFKLTLHYDPRSKSIFAEE